MSSCSLLEKCIFFRDKMPIESPVGAMYKRKYCQGQHAICARYKVAQAIGRENVPTDLYPNMFERAEKIIADHQRS